MKHLEGKQIWLLPTGNYAKRSKEPKTVYVSKVARVFVTLDFSERYNKRCRFNSLDNILDAGNNSGYLYFESEQDLKDHKEAIKLAREIAGACENTYTLSKLPLSKLKGIVRILNMDMDITK